MRRLAKPLLSMLVAALATISLAATQAAADTVEVTSEVDSAHCAVELLNCRFYAASEDETELWVHAFGIQILVSECEDQFEGVIGEDGEGSVYQYGTTPTNGCTRENCAGPESVWPAHLRETGTGQERLALRLCLANLEGQQPQHCDIELEAETTHGSIEAFADETPCTNMVNPRWEFSGHWVTQIDGDHPQLEVVHM